MVQNQMVLSAKEVLLFCVKCVQFIKEEMGATSNRTSLTVI
uniref:Uncharacterized protein n=1 Tax=Meloidogyne enterolobii TaxID=390850 RepID=A0A6V7X6P2_MELEN|nr:unnamed protein product [Meloidogyne enterolobii]